MERPWGSGGNDPDGRVLLHAGMILENLISRVPQPSEPQLPAHQTCRQLQAAEQEQGRRVLLNQQLGTPRAGFTVDLPVPFEKEPT